MNWWYSELQKLLKKEPYFDYSKLREVTKVVTRNLNKVIDINYYPVPETENSNKRHRPIGIGVQGLADDFVLLGVSFDSLEADEINEKIFETIYYGALETSCELAEEREQQIKEYLELEEKLKTCYDLDMNAKDLLQQKNELFQKLHLREDELKRENYIGTYSSYVGSPLSKDLLQFDLWDQKPFGLWDWDDLAKESKNMAQEIVY